MVHADFFSNGEPTASDFASNSLNAWARIFFQSFSLVCVNVFVLISGWFGIKPSLKGFFKFIFQIVFFYLGVYLFEVIFFGKQITLLDIRTILLLSSGAGWFVIAYIGLYVLSPVLNAFVEKADRKTLATTVIYFYAFQTITWLSSSAPFVVNGYSTFSFIGLYLLARLLRICKCDNYKWGWVTYLSFVSLNTLLFYFVIKHNSQIYVNGYSNILIVLASASLLIWASSWKMKHSKLINWISASAFAVYLFHMNPFTMGYYSNYCRYFYHNYNGILCLCGLGLVMLVTFVISILLDQPRKWLWKWISQRYNPSLNFRKNQLVAK